MVNIKDLGISIDDVFERISEKTQSDDKEVYLQMLAERILKIKGIKPEGDDGYPTQEQRDMIFEMYMPLEFPIIKVLDFLANELEKNMQREI